MPLSFYGGPNGKSFYIKEYFTSYYSVPTVDRTDENLVYNSLKDDEQKGWTSPIGVGEFVLITYGKPGSTSYEFFLKNDTDPRNEFPGNYNSYLYQKVYDEENGSDTKGIYYQYVTSLTGNTPRIIMGDATGKEVPLQEFTKILDADAKPVVWMDISNQDTPILYFALPQSQVFSINQPTTVLDADQNPQVVYDEGTLNNDGDRVPGEYGGTINRPVIDFKIPQSQRIETAIVKSLKANDTPYVICEIGSRDGSGNIQPGDNGGTINKPVLVLGLPKSQILSKGDITVLDADQEPSFDIDDSDPDNPILKFSLPQAQVMQSPDTTVIGPDGTPSVSLDDQNINKPKLEFKLPRAVKFYYGSLLGQRQDVTYTETNDAFADYGIGDYYVNAETGFIYKVIAKNETTCTFEYQACIQQPLPDVNTVGISPYTTDGNQNTPKVVRAYTNNEQTAWRLEFQLPKIPKPAVNATFIGPLEKGEVGVEITNPDTITFNFKIPAGSRMFAGDEVKSGHYDTVVAGAKPGDLYLNSKTGIIYILQSSGVWEVQQGSLKGPPGDALHIVRNYTINNADDFTVGKNYILDNYKDDEGNAIPLKPDEIFAVTFIDAANEKEVSYWYFYTEDNQWGRVQLTGGVMNLIENNYVESPENSPVTNKTYSIDYINKLIGGKIDAGNADKTAFSKDQIYSLLSWGTFADAIAGEDVPDPDNHDTLSAAEVLELMSWGKIIKLQA